MLSYIMLNTLSRMMYKHDVLYARSMYSSTPTPGVHTYTVLSY